MLSLFGFLGGLATLSLKDLHTSVMCISFVRMYASVCIYWHPPLLCHRVFHRVLDHQQTDHGVPWVPNTTSDLASVTVIPGYLTNGIANLSHRGVHLSVKLPPEPGICCFHGQGTHGTIEPDHGTNACSFLATASSRSFPDHVPVFLLQKMHQKYSRPQLLSDTQHTCQGWIRLLCFTSPTSLFNSRTSVALRSCSRSMRTWGKA